ncbi:MAG TPA: hypothetical protein VMV56_07710 [Williamwhitmania sp.]|nr:hypothetical protein [Williamwhitmania sp.]
MIQRCCDIKHKQYRHYGGRGITICSVWRTDYKAFYDWAIKRWGKDLQIDRIDNDGNYEPNNCRFVTPKENIRNSRICKITKESADKIRAEYIENRNGYKKLGKKYNISWSNVRNIIRRGQFI